MVRGTNGRECFALEVPDRTAATLEEAIRQNILPGTTIISDGWASYANISTMDNGVYAHEIIIHDENYVDPDDPEIHTQSAEGMWSRMKLKFRNRKGVLQAHYFSHISEFVWQCRLSGNWFGNFLNTLREQL